MHPFRKLRQSSKPTAARVSELLAENIVFNSPILVRPIEGREVIAAISMLQNSGFVIRAIKKSRNSGDLSVVGLLHSSSGYLSSYGHEPFGMETSSLMFGRNRRPVRPMADWNHELGYWLRGALKLRIQHNRRARQICTPNLGIC